MGLDSCAAEIIVGADVLVACIGQLLGQKVAENT
jgi:hypothetical protein